MTFGPRLEPPEPLSPCCHLAEDDPDHDSQACLEAGAEADAERRAEAQRDREFDRDWDAA